MPAPNIATSSTVFANFWLYRAMPQQPRWPVEHRAAVAKEAVEIINRNADTVQLRAAYSTVGLSAGVDLILWVIASDPAAFQRLAVDLHHSAVGDVLTVEHAYLGTASTSQYDPAHGPAFLRGIPPKRYLSVYPFTKTPAWYLLPFEERREMMKVHGALGDEFPTILTNTVSSFGIADQEFVVALEDDDPAVLVEMVQKLRLARVREYTQVDTPIFLGLRMEPEEAFRAAL